MESPEEIEKALAKLVPSALSERGQRDLEELIDSLAADESPVAAEKVRPGLRRLPVWVGGIGAAAAAVVISLNLPAAKPVTEGGRQFVAENSAGVVPAADEVVLLGQVERVEAAEPEDLVWETDGVAHRAWRFRVVNEERVQDLQTGYEVTVSRPREKVVLMPVTAF